MKRGLCLEGILYPPSKCRVAVAMRKHDGARVCLSLARAEGVLDVPTRPAASTPEGVDKTQLSWATNLRLLKCADLGSSFTVDVAMSRI